MKGGRAEEAQGSKRKGLAATEKQLKRQAKKEKKQKKDPNKPKRAPSAFFVFLAEFRKTYMEAHPNTKVVSEVAKAAGEKWKNMSDAEKSPYQAKSDKLKGDFEKQMAAYNKQQSGGTVAEPTEESDKSKSEVNDDEEDSEEDDV